MSSRRYLSVLFGVLMFLAFAGCQQYVTIQYRFPPKQEIPASIKNITVAKVEDLRGKPNIGEKVRKMLESDLRNAPGKPYEIVARGDKMVALLDEKELGRSDFVEQSASDTQAFAAVDAYIWGAVTDYEANEGQQNMNVEVFYQERVGTDSKGRAIYETRSRWEPRVHFRRWGKFGVTFEMVEKSKGMILASSSPALAFDTGWQQQQPPSAGMIIEQKMKEAIQEFAKEIAPYFERYTRVVDKSGGEQGIKALRDGQFDMAIGLFETELQKKPRNAGAYYNMSIALCGLGRFQEALEKAKEAYSISLNSMHADQIKHIEEVMAKMQKSADSIQ